MSRLERIGVREGDQFLETVGGLRLGKTEGDRVVRVGRCQYCGDLLEACPRIAHAEVRHRAQQLIAAVQVDLVSSEHAVVWSVCGAFTLGTRSTAV
jgi:hypothetical protein